MKIRFSSIILFAFIALVNSDGLDETSHNDQPLEMTSQTMNEVKHNPHHETAGKSVVSQQTHTVVENQQKQIQKVSTQNQFKSEQPANEQKKPHFTENTNKKAETDSVANQPKTTNNDLQSKLQQSATAEDAKKSLPITSVPQPSNLEKQKIAHQQTNVDSSNSKMVISSQVLPAVQSPSNKGPSKKQRTTPVTRKPMQFNNEIDRVFHQIFELIAWEKYDIPDDKVDVMYSARNKMRCLARNKFNKIDSTLKECNQAVPNLIGMAQMTGKTSLKKEHTPMMVKTCLFGQLLSGREAHGFGLMGLLKDLSERPLNSNTMLTNIRSQISASSLSNDQKGKAMEDAKKCIADVMPVSNLVLQTFTDTKGAILDKFVVKWMTMMFNNKWEPNPASDISELKSFFVILKGSMCLVKSLTTNGCYLKN